MSEVLEITDRDRVALLKQGIVVLSVEAGEATLRVSVSGGHEDWVVPALVAQLGPGIEVDVCGRLPRELRPRGCVGYMEREARRLQLRYVVHADEHLEDIVVAEDDREVVVFATISTPVEWPSGEAMECPYHVYLDRPLAGRTVIDGWLHQPVPFKNVYLELERKLAGGFRRHGRRAAP